MSNQHKRVLLLGYFGSGKTSLFNLITKAEEEVKQGGKSVTQRIVIGSTQQLRGFEILDTPGFSPEETIESLAGVLAGLYYGDIHRILMVQMININLKKKQIIVRNDRIQMMISHIDKMFSKVQQLKSIITIVVTWFDIQTNEPEKQKENFTHTILEKFGITSILFVSNPESTRKSDQACQQTILSSNEAPLTYMASKKIFDNLKLPEYVDLKRVEQAGDEIEREFRKFAKIYIRFIEEFDFKNPHTLDIMHSLQIDIKKQAERYIDDFSDKYGEVMNKQFDLYKENKQYILYIRLKQAITVDYQGVIQKAQEKIKAANINYYNWIKRCPKCKLIWVKVVGCGGKTKCGNLAKLIDQDKSMSASQDNKRFQFIIENGKLIAKEIIAQEKQWNYKNVIAQFLNDNNLIKAQNQDEIMQIVQESLKQLKDYYFSKFQEINHKRQKGTIEAHSLIQSLQNLMLLLLEDPIKRILNQLWGQEIEKYFDSQNDFSNSLLKLYTDEVPQFVKDCGFLTLSEEKWLSKMLPTNQTKYLGLIKFALQQNQKEIQNSYIGCGEEFFWDDEPPLSNDLLKALFSPDLYDYFTDFIQFEKDENSTFSEENLQSFQIAVTGRLQKVKILS